MFDISVKPNDISCLTPEAFLASLDRRGVTVDRFIEMYSGCTNPSIDPNRIFAVIAEIEVSSRVSMVIAPDAHTAGRISLYAYDYETHCEYVQVCGIIGIMSVLGKSLN
jgi:hypothetical protein